MLKFHHVGIEVSDIERSRSFYVGFLGFQPIGNICQSKEFNESYLMLQRDGVTLELLISHEKSIDFVKRPIRFHLAFESDNVDSLVDRAKEQGVRIVRGPITVPGEVRLITLLDPDDYLIDVGQLV